MEKLDFCSDRGRTKEAEGDELLDILITKRILAYACNIYTYRFSSLGSHQGTIWIICYHCVKLFIIYLRLRISQNWLLEKTFQSFFEHGVIKVAHNALVNLEESLVLIFDKLKLIDDEDVCSLLSIEYVACSVIFTI